MTYKDGDVVSRKAGGPMMTVEETRTDNLVAVVWFDGIGDLHRDCFAGSVLQKWQIVEE